MTKEELKHKELFEKVTGLKIKSLTFGSGNNEYFILNTSFTSVEIEEIECFFAVKLDYIISQRDDTLAFFIDDTEYLNFYKEL